MSLTVTPSASLDRDGCRRVIDGLSAPAPHSSLIEWLTMCAVLTAPTRDDELSGELKLKAFAQKLSVYPGDIVRHVLESWPDQSKWFPAWADLKAAIEKHAGIRPMLVDRVRDVIGGDA